MENPVKMDDLGVPIILETSIFVSPCITGITLLTFSLLRKLPPRMIPRHYNREHFHQVWFMRRYTAVITEIVLDNTLQ